jgi:hypothetical protein
MWTIEHNVCFKLFTIFLFFWNVNYNDILRSFQKLGTWFKNFRDSCLIRYL